MLDKKAIGVETETRVVYNTLVDAALAHIEGAHDINLCFIELMRGGLAQLGEHYVRNVGVGGSTPLPSTTLVNLPSFSQ